VLTLPRRLQRPQLRLLLQLRLPLTRCVAAELLLPLPPPPVRISTVAFMKKTTTTTTTKNAR
jgi:hypothetical protein